MALFAANVLLFWGHFSGKGERRDALAGLEEKIAEETASLQELERSLDEIDLESQNEEIAFLNEKIEDRSFPWSAFFDRLAEVLPPTVRLQRVSPRANLGGRQRRARRGVAGQETVGLSLAGTAASGEDVLALVDAFFDHPSFLDPNLSSEAKREDSQVEFSLTVRYVDRPTEVVTSGAPAAPEAATDAASEPPPADRAEELAVEAERSG